MDENIEHSEEEYEEGNLKNENEFLKMKMMLESGAQFGSMSEEGLPPEIENQFLRNIMAFEKQAQEMKMIKIFDKIERPDHFKPVSEISDEDIDNAWKTLNEYLNKYGIELSFLSPKVTTRELYRFTMEELFDHEMNDMDLPGMVSCFTYDEFHPDHEYENKRTSVEDVIEHIFENEPYQWMHHFRRENLRLNEHFQLTQDEFKNLVNRFKESYVEIKLEPISQEEDVLCFFEKEICQVKGPYELALKLPLEEIILRGNWMVEYELDDDLGYWYVINVQVEGINF
jgi:hypothetical protein